jgi:hypothetical protein
LSRPSVSCGPERPNHPLGVIAEKLFTTKDIDPRKLIEQTIDRAGGRLFLASGMGRVVAAYSMENAHSRRLAGVVGFRLSQ